MSASLRSDGVRLETAGSRSSGLDSRKSSSSMPSSSSIGSSLARLELLRASPFEGNLKLSQHLLSI